uniref:Uncharacterized protein n=1 Tax=Cacopsylla melanoneura TaxID=428564 RepID=A0A8D8QP57_9HEMI
MLDFLNLIGYIMLMSDIRANIFFINTSVSLFEFSLSLFEPSLSLFEPSLSLFQSSSGLFEPSLILFATSFNNFIFTIDVDIVDHEVLCILIFVSSSWPIYSDEEGFSFVS